MIEGKEVPIKKSVFVKIFIMLIITMFCFSGMAILISHISNTNIKKEIIKSEYSKLNYFLTSFEDEIARMVNFQKEYLYDSDLLLLSATADVISQYQKVDSIRRVYEKLIVIKSSSEFIEKISVHIPLIEKTITSESPSDDLQVDEVMAFRTKDSYDTDPILQYKDDLYLSFPYYSDTYLEDSILFLITVKLSKDSIKENLKEVSLYNNSSIVLFNPNQEWSIISSNEMELDHNLPLIDSYDFGDATPREITIENRDYILFGSYSEYLNIQSLYSVYEAAAYSPLYRYRIFIYAIMITTILLLIFFSYWIYYTFKVPMNKLVFAFKDIEKEKFDIEIYHKSHDEFEYVFKRFNKMANRIRHLIENEYQHDIMLKDALLKQYQYKMNPHMLYNSLYFIYRMAKLQDNEDVAKFSLVIADYYKFINQHAASEVSLLDEVLHCKNYTKIQSSRFGKRIEVEFLYEEDEIKDMMVPSLIIQPLLENCYKYAFDNFDKKRIIKITIRKEDALLTITVEDNGIGLDSLKIKEINEKLNASYTNEDLGSLVNINKRLKIKYGEKSALTIEKREVSGLRAIIKIVL